MSITIKVILQDDTILSLLDESEKRYVLKQLNLPYDSGINDAELLRLTFFLSNCLGQNFRYS